MCVLVNFSKESHVLWISEFSTKYSLLLVCIMTYYGIRTESCAVFVLSSSRQAVETRRMVLKKIEPQPAILRSYDMAHYYPLPTLLPILLFTRLGKSLTRFPREPLMSKLRPKAISALFLKLPSIRFTVSAVLFVSDACQSFSFFPSLEPSQQHRRDVGIFHHCCLQACRLAPSSLGTIRAQSSAQR